METIEIRLFGPMLVRRADGSVVQQAEWRTSKTMDLLRLLALNAGQAVTISSLLDKLWPEVEAERGRASLRTAASQLRKILRTDNLERRPGSMILHHRLEVVTVPAVRGRPGQGQLSGVAAELVEGPGQGGPWPTRRPSR